MNRNIIIVDRTLVRSENLARACSKFDKTFDIFIFPDDPNTNKGKKYIPETDDFKKVEGNDFIYIDQDRYKNNDSTQSSIEDDDLSFSRSDETLSIPLPNSWDLALRHYRNDDIVLKKGVKLEIWYGGAGAEYEQGKEWNINVNLDGQEDIERCILNSWLAEVFNWALSSERDQINIPYILIRRDYTMASSLAIQCQGYLAASFPVIDHKAKEKISKALIKMGWDKLIMTENGKRPSCFGKTDEERLSKWRNILSRFEKKSLLSKICVELGLNKLPEEILKLIDGVYGNDWPKEKDGRQRDHNEVIAEGYLKIADELERLI